MTGVSDRDLIAKARQHSGREELDYATDKLILDLADALDELRHLAERCVSPHMCTDQCDHADDYTRQEALEDLERHLRATGTGQATT